MPQYVHRFQGQLRVTRTKREWFPPSLGGLYTPVSKLVFLAGLAVILFFLYFHWPKLYSLNQKIYSRYKKCGLDVDKFVEPSMGFLNPYSLSRGASYRRRNWSRHI